MSLLLKLREEFIANLFFFGKVIEFLVKVLLIGDVFLLFMRIDEEGDVANLWDLGIVYELIEWRRVEDDWEL